MPLISVVMSVYNDADHLPLAMDSILGQTWDRLEFIVIDDGSQDATPEILAAYAACDKRVRVLTQPVNKGLAACLNRGIAEASGEFIARMDSDDIAHPERFSRQVAHLQSHPDIDVLGTFAEDIDEAGRPTGRIRSMPTGSTNVARLVWSSPMIHPTVMFRAERIKRLGGYKEILQRKQDYELWFRAVEAGLKLDNLPEILLQYRESSQSAEKHSLKSAWQQMIIGLHGSLRMRAGIKAYVGVAVPFLVRLMPGALRGVTRKCLRFFDPRRAP